MSTAATLSTLPFDPRVRRRTGNNLSITAESPEPVAPVTPEQQVAAFDAAHPFAPAGSFTPEPVSVSPAPGLYAGADGEVANSDPYADERGAGEAVAMQRAVMPGMYPASGFNGVANVRNSARAASQGLYGMPATGGGGRGAANADPYGLPDGAASGLSPVLTAALGIQQLKREAVAGDSLANMASAGALFNPETDTPEIRSRKLQYMEQRMDDTIANQLDPSQPLPRAAGTPVYTGDLQRGQAGRMTMNGRTYAGGPGGIPSALELARTSTEIPNLNAAVARPGAPTAPAAGNRGLSMEMAQLAERLRNTSRQPKLVSLGTDSLGRKVEGIQDAQGNFSRISAPNEGAGTQLNQLIKERDNYAAAGNQAAVEQYDVAIANYGQQYDITGQPIRRATGTVPPPPPTDPGGPVQPGQSPRTLSQADQQALQWARGNARDARAVAIFKRLGVEN